MDPKDQRSIDAKEEEVEDVIELTNEKKCCTDCRTTSTPLWRGGPAGPKSLCNACGIKYNKKRRAQMNGFDKNGRRSANSMKMKLTVTDRTQAKHHHNHHHQQQQQQQHQHKHQQDRKHHRLHQQHQQKRKRSSYERGKPWWNKLREEEQAAILLMAISCGGSLY